jgi:hypothetical protein
MKSIRCRFGFHKWRTLWYRWPPDRGRVGKTRWLQNSMCDRCGRGRLRDDMAYFTSEEMEQLGYPGMTGANAR